MKPFRRPGFSATDLLMVLAMLGVVAGLLLTTLVRARLAAVRVQSMNNLKQIGLAAHVYHDSESNFPAGNDKNNYSALAHLLPYVEEGQVYKQIDFSKPVDDPANDKARKVAIKFFESPLDPQKTVIAGRGATSYLFCAGSKPGLKDNNGVFCQESSVSLGQITNSNGSTNTLLAVETLKGDGGVKAVDVRRQHVNLKPETSKPPVPLQVDEKRLEQLIADLDSNQFETRKKATEELEKLGEAIEPALKKARAKNASLDLSKRLDQLLLKIANERRERELGPIAKLKEDAGVADWKAGTNIAGDRGSSWLDGRFLQGTFTATLPFNDSRPDVNVMGHGGLSAMRNLDTPVILTAFCDGHVQAIPVKFDFANWKRAANWKNTEPFTLP